MSTFYDPGYWEGCTIWVKASDDFSLDNPYEAKCLYVLGTIKHLLYAANKLYPKSDSESDHRLPACILGFNILELMGRCLNGDTEHKGNFDKRIKTGLRYIAELEGGKTRTIYTPIKSYQIPSDALVKIRNFTAHGFYGSTDQYLAIDGLLVAWLFAKIAKSTRRYYEELKAGKGYKNMLKATVEPLINSETRKLVRIQPLREDIIDDLDISEPKEKTWNWSEDYNKHDYYKKIKYDSGDV